MMYLAVLLALLIAPPAPAWSQPMPPPAPGAWPTWAPGRMMVHVINVGQGNCVLIQCPAGQNILVDCGSSTTRDSGNVDVAQNYIASALAPTAAANGGPLLFQTVILTHPDRDHWSMLPEVIPAGAASPYRVNRFLYGGKAMPKAPAGTQSIAEWARH